MIVIRPLAAMFVLGAIGFFAWQLWRTPIDNHAFKYGALAFMTIIGLAGAIAIVTYRDDEIAPLDGERTYTAAEVASLLEAVRSSARSESTSGTCVYCNESGAEIGGLGGRRYHRACFQQAHRSERPS